ncbi:MAG TPA: sugar phosphate isomerase [Phycisphaerales bacterium]|nr:sugar phosphate isomerase [Phycisphaerales bacterium]|tara:strand:+ start:1508 stop:2401 length:894 start_codon:yes stop_codon:yes gene_type:complete
MSQLDIRIGTLVNRGQDSPAYIREILPYGFESFSLTFWQTLGKTNLKKLAKEVNAELEGSDAVISSLGVFGNPLMDDAAAKSCREGWKKLIDAAPLFGCDVICGFAGRIVDKPIDASMDRYAKVFKPLAKRAADKGVKIAFENCDMGGTWKQGGCNIAQYPAAWDMMFNAIDADNIGLEWEPCHQMVKLIDPMPQLRKYMDRIFHVHGKDATIKWDVIKEYGITGPHQFAFHRTPGFGDSNWTDIISELRRGGFKGCIDIEGWHDPVYRDDLEMTGQVHGMKYLKQCRGGDFVPNPK